MGIIDSLTADTVRPPPCPFADAVRKRSALCYKSVTLLALVGPLAGLMPSNLWCYQQCLNSFEETGM